MPQEGSASVTLPKALLDEVKQFVEKNPRWVNPTEFVKEAVRLRLEQLVQEARIR